jgi:hypothetical protein
MTDSAHGTVVTARPKGDNGSLREISAELAAAATTKTGKPYAATAIKLMLQH